MSNFSIIAIASIVDDKNTIIGYRLLNTDGQQAECKNIPKVPLINALANGNVTVDNLAVIPSEKGKNEMVLVGTQGSIDRLPTVRLSGELVGNKAKKSPLTIINKLEDVGYTVADYKGAIKFMRVDEVVAYSKEFGITNGKVVTRNGVEFISAINGAYKEGKLKRVNRAKIQPKDIVENGDAKVARNLTKADNLKGIAKTADIQVSEEIEYNDTFRLLNEEQRKAIRSYYAWWTVKTFEGLAGSRKLEVTPKKAAELAKLKRNVTWNYKESMRASVYCERGYDYCTLGHKLKTVHFAIGVDDKTGEVETIKFGSTCIADFFDISVEGVRKLDKVAGIMSEEIELMTNIARENRWEQAWNNVGLISDIVERINNEEVCKELFGERVGTYLIVFKRVGLAYPASMVKMAREYANEHIKTETFWKKVYQSETNRLDGINLVYSDYGRARNGIAGTLQCALDHFYNVMLEGIYSYDPIKKVGDRGKGRFTKEAAYKRKKLNSALKFRLGIKQFRLEEIDKILDILHILKNIHNNIEDINTKYFDTEEFNRYIEENRYTKKRKIKNYQSSIRQKAKDFMHTHKVMELTDEIKALSFGNQLILKILRFFLDEDDLMYDYYSYDKVDSNVALLIPKEELAYGIDESLTLYKTCESTKVCEKLYKRYLQELICEDIKVYKAKKAIEEQERLEGEKRNLQKEKERLELENNLAAKEEPEQDLEELKQDLEKEFSNEKDADNTKDSGVKPNEYDNRLNKILLDTDKSNGIICLNEECKYNFEGNCKILMALGHSGNVVRAIRTDEHNVVKTCTLNSTIKSKFDEVSTALIKAEDKQSSSLDTLYKLRLLNRDGIYTFNIKEGTKTFIAKDIINRSRYTKTEDLSVKQKAIIKSELDRLEHVLKSTGIEYNYESECFIDNTTNKVINNLKEMFESQGEKLDDTHKMGDVSDGENRTYDLDDYAEIKDKIDKVITALDNNGIDLDSKTISILKTVLIRKRFSDKQYKYIKQAIESLA